MKLLKFIWRKIAGHEYRVVITGDNAKVNWYHSETLQDAYEWMQCAHKSDTVKIIDRNGCFVASRKPYDVAI